MTALQHETISVVAPNEEEALREAAIIAGIDAASLQVVSGEEVSRLPWQPKRMRYAIRQRPTHESLDGSWEVDFQDGGIWLTVFPPKGAGSPIMPEELLLARRSEFVGAVTEKLLAYALGRSIKYYDYPAIRKIIRETAATDHRWSSVVAAVTRSVPFQMRRSEP